MFIERLDGSRVKATYIRHIRTLTGWQGHDIDLYRLADGSTVQAASPDNDGRAVPIECDMRLDGYAGHYPGQ